MGEAGARGHQQGKGERRGGRWESATGRGAAGSRPNPREGAAIATAVLEELLTRGAMVLVTTHLEELKAQAHLDPR